MQVNRGWQGQSTQCMHAASLSSERCCTWVGSRLHFHLGFAHLIVDASTAPAENESKATWSFSNIVYDMAGHCLLSDQYIIGCPFLIPLTALMSLSTIVLLYFRGMPGASRWQSGWVSDRTWTCPTPWCSRNWMRSKSRSAERFAKSWRSKKVQRTYGR